MTGVPCCHFFSPEGKNTFCSQNSYHTNMWYIFTTFNFKVAGWIGQCCQTTFHGPGQTIIYSSAELRSHEAWDDCCVSYVSLHWPGRLPNASLEQFHHLFTGFFRIWRLFYLLPFTNRLASPGLGSEKNMHYVSEEIPKQWTHRFATKKIPVSDRKQKFSLKILYKPKTLDARCIFHTTRHIYTEGSDTTN